MLKAVLKSERETRETRETRNTEILELRCRLRDRERESLKIISFFQTPTFQFFFQLSVSAFCIDGLPSPLLCDFSFEISDASEIEPRAPRSPRTRGDSDIAMI